MKPLEPIGTSSKDGKLGLTDFVGWGFVTLLEIIPVELTSIFPSLSYRELHAIFRLLHYLDGWQ